MLPPGVPKRRNEPLPLAIPRLASLLRLRNGSSGSPASSSHFGSSPTSCCLASSHSRLLCRPGCRGCRRSAGLGVADRSCGRVESLPQLAAASQCAGLKVGQSNLQALNLGLGVVGTSRFLLCHACGYGAPLSPPNAAIPLCATR